MFDSRSARITAILALVAAVLLVGGSLYVTSGADASTPQSEAASAPSYSALRPLLRDGAGKDDKGGEVEVFQLGNPDPAAWIKAIRIPGTDTYETWIVKHSSFKEPAPGEEIPTTYESVEGPTPGNMDAFLLWIVDTYGHVEGIGELAPEPLD